jgi:hypothetical protein
MSLSPSKSDKFITRYGPASPSSPLFGGETRFNWQSSNTASDVVYELPDMNGGSGFQFGTGGRQGMDDNPDAKKRSTGPGSYHAEGCYEFSSEYPTRRAFRFGGSARQSMAQKTPSPGAVYNTDGLYNSGSNKTIPIAFGTDVRRPLNGMPASQNADMLWPALPKGKSVTIGSKLNKKSRFGGTPGAIYDVHKKVDFKTGPSFSFGKSKASRFKEDMNKLSLDMEDMK